jgi:arginyl-tRNA synthetase
LLAEEIIDQLHETLQSRVLAVLGHPAGTVVLEEPRDVARRDLVTSVVAHVARLLKRDPHAAAEAVANGFPLPQLVKSVTAEASGELTFRFRRGAFTFELWRRLGGDAADEHAMERLTLDDGVDDARWRAVRRNDVPDADPRAIVELFRGPLLQ